MKSFRSLRGKKRAGAIAFIVTIFVGASLRTAWAELPAWIPNTEARSTLEAVFFRAMALPGGEVLHRRPPSETRPALRELITQQPKDARLYSLLALEDEQQLDFTAAEADWKRYLGASADKAEAQLSLADFYHRRLRPLDEIAVLTGVANAPSSAAEKLTPAANQKSWQAFERIFGIIREQGLAKEMSAGQYRDWIARYPNEPSLYSQFLDFLITQQEYAAANQLIEDYGKHFPEDDIFPVKAKALVEYKAGSLPQGLAVYEKSFQPLWNPELVKGYFDLMGQTHSLRKFLDEQRAALSANPEDLRATALVFYYYQQQGKLDAAEQELERFRLHKEAAHSEWSSRELFVCARLLEDVHAYPESARYYFALYNAKVGNDSQQQALVGLARLLFAAPEAPIRFGAGELSMYRDIATMDQGPGYLNGILSLILNSSEPAEQFSAEEQRAVPYFHRARAAQLVELLDTKFPNAPERAELHISLIEYYASAGESDAVIRAGKEFLASFPQASQRTQVALLMADAYARENNAKEEFAIYDSVLKELAANAEGIPLGNGAARLQGSYRQDEDATYEPEPYSEEAPAESYDANENPANNSSDQAAQNAAFSTTTRTAESIEVGARSPEYSRVLERYLARLAQMKQIPQAVGVLRTEIEHNPDDPGLYERLASFLEQNQLKSEQEQVYKQAMARFPDRSWYHKLARLYLRHKESADFESLTQEVVKLFNGTDLEAYFQSVVSGGSPALYVRLNQYANERFPHNPVFVKNLLGAYQWPETRNQAAWEKLLRQHWFEETQLRNEFFEYLSRTGRLDAELQILRENDGADERGHRFDTANPAAGEYLAEADLWRSHCEQSAPVLKTLAEMYPANNELGKTAAAVYRSLAYFQSANTETAVKLNENLLAANPRSSDLLARIGDTFADREQFSRAAPYWNRIPQLAPGDMSGYLTAATIYWDYFDFADALRLLEEARRKSGNDSLYAYEEGAIYEGQREFSKAIREYVKGSLAAGAGSPSQSRLLQLARRTQYRDLVDAETKKRTDSAAPTMAEITLRVDVLDALSQTKEAEPLLEAALSRAATLEQATDIESLATQRSLESVREHALEKEASLSSDPVTRLQLRYTLARLYEDKKDFASAQKNIEDIYRENPKILGVVRSTTDFYWRVKLHTQAIGVLQQAARDAYPELSKQFTFEAARKSTDAKLYAQAREMLTSLLKDSPYDGQYVAAMADTYAKEGNQEGLKQFYLDEIAGYRTAPLSQDEKKTQIATLRRGLIPALGTLKDYSGGVDQYIELINAFPEDDGIANEAALYAQLNHQEERLLQFYVKTVQQSPRDYRWSMALARIQTALEDYASAIDSYGHALAIRPDRVDLRTARAGLEERLMRFDDAAADYEKLYELAYKDPQWMERVAEIRARQGRPETCVAALKTALIDGQPERPGKYFDAARKLEAWGMLAEARTLAEQGVNVAGAGLLAETENHAGAALYARIMTRLRQQDAAYAKLQDALSVASAELPAIEQQVAKNGIAAVTDSEWRERVQETREENARTGLTGALREMGKTAAIYFAPEEKVSFAQFAEELRAPMDSADVESFAIPLSQEAGLEDLEARWRYELTTVQEAGLPALMERMQAYEQLQRRRLKFEEMAPQIEKFAGRLPAENQPPFLLDAARTYRSAGDTEDELRVLSLVWPGRMSNADLNRFFELLLQLNPQQLVRTAENWTPWGEQAADFAVANGSAQVAHEVVSARSQGRAPVWKSAYGALTGLYFAETSPSINQNFLSALGDETIGERIGRKIGRDERLAGDIWFYYGSRYGEYLDVLKQGDSEDFLPAVLEQSPASFSGYMQVADYHSERREADAALKDYFHVLELNPSNVGAHDKMAIVYLQQGDSANAKKQWQMAIAGLSKEVQEVSVPESFWADFAHVCEHSTAHHLFGELKPDVDALLRVYIKKNGDYRSAELLKSAYEALRDPVGGVTWLLDLSRASTDETFILTDVANAKWIPLQQRGPIYARILAVKRDAVEKAVGLEKQTAQDELKTWQVRWARYLIESKQYAAASDFLNTLPAATREADAEFMAIDLEAAAHLGSLDGKLAVYRADEERAPTAETLRKAATELRTAGDEASSRKILEFVFAREIDQRHLSTTNFLGLAEIKIVSGDMNGAMELLHRLVGVVGDPFENLDPAAALLEKTGHSAEAMDFLSQLVKTTPWNGSYKLRLAKAKIAAHTDVNAAMEELGKIASDDDYPYNTRTEAAAALAGHEPKNKLGSKELDLLAGVTRLNSVATADQPFFYEARIRAAKNMPNSKVKLKLLRNAVADIPQREDARYLLFEAAANTHADELALAALEGTPAMQGQVYPAIDQTPQRFREEMAIRPDRPDTEDEESNSAAAISPSHTREQQARIAFELAEVYERLGKLNESATRFEGARKLERSAQRRKEMAGRAARVKKELQRLKQNAARRPILHEALEQAHLVRPRIPATAQAAPANGADQ